MEGDKLTQKRVGVKKRIVNAMCGDRAGRYSQAFPLEEPGGAQHVITVADQNGARNATLVKDETAIGGAFFGAAAGFFQDNCAFGQAASGQDLAAGGGFTAREGLGLRAGA